MRWHSPPVRYDLSNIDFGHLSEEFLRTSAMTIAINLERVDLYQRYSEIIATYNKNKDNAEIQRVFDELIAFNKSLQAES